MQSKSMVEEIYDVKSQSKFGGRLESKQIIVKAGLRWNRRPRQRGQRAQKGGRDLMVTKVPNRIRKCPGEVKSPEDGVSV